MITRRHFINGLGWSALLPFLPRIAFADGVAHKNFVLIKIANGWDVTLGLEPRTHDDGTDQEDIFLEYGSADIVDAQGFRLGPAAAALKPFVSQLAVINGVAMAASDTGHSSSLTYISTGNGQGHAPDLPVEVAASQGQGLIGVVTDSVISTLGRTVSLTTVSSLQNSGADVSPGSYLDFLKKMPSRHDFAKAAIDNSQDPAVKAKLAAEIQKRSADVQALSSMGLDVNSQSLRTSGLLMAAAFASGASYQGQISTSYNIDSHSNHEKNHLTEQTKAWNAVAEVFKHFQATPAANGSGSLFDQTLFMVVSEFARTPALNAAKGKDHNPFTNSVLLAGGPVVRPQTLGASAVVSRAKRRSGASIHTALPMDFSTGQVATTRQQADGANFTYIQPEHVVSTVVDLLGIVDRSRFQSVAAETPRLKPLLG